MVVNQLKAEDFLIEWVCDNTVKLTSKSSGVQYTVKFIENGFNLSFLREAPETNFEAEGSLFSRFRFTREVSIFVAISQVGREPRFLG